jgi:MarR family transcriptional regulator for hemolysin
MNAGEDRRREELGSEIAALMSSLGRELRAGFVACAGELGLGPAEAQALWILAARGPTTTGELGRALGVDPANASTLITGLGRRGLVERRPDTSDRRKRVVSLTAEGRRATERLSRCMSERRPTFGRLTTRELESFRELLAKLGSES